jgi:hypothetical protein
MLFLIAAACGPADTVPQAQPAPTTIPTTIATTVASLAMPVPGTPLVTEPFQPPPALHVRGGGTDTVLGLWSSCWQSGNSNRCADGHPPDVPDDIGHPADVEVAFDSPGWRFSATFVPSGQECGGRTQEMPLTATGPTTHRLLPAGRAGDYTVHLFGRSTEAATNKGDVATTFRWHTISNGPNQAPSATMSLLATSPQVKVSLGAELTATALGVSTRPATVEASAVVTTSTGRSMEVVFKPIEADCTPEGAFFLRSDADDGRTVGTLGPAPYRYDVRLVLSGVVYRGAGVWPQDEIHDCSPCTSLVFTPPLPAL